MGKLVSTLEWGGMGWKNGKDGPRDRLMFCVELSLTVPITNSLAFLFTVLGEWWAEKKVINRGMFWEKCRNTGHGLTTDRYLDRDGVRSWRNCIMCTKQVIDSVGHMKLYRSRNDLHNDYMCVGCP